MAGGHEHHHHNHEPAAPPSGAAARRMLWAVVLTSVILAGEVVGGIWAGSLALLSDAAHVFMDVFALALALGAMMLARRPASDKRTFGWHRAEVFAALINGLSLFAVAVIIFVEGVQRLFEPTEVRGVGLLVIATVGLLANGAVALLLRGHVGADINLRAALWHVVGDALASVGVIAGAVVVILTGWYIVDPILALAIGVLLLWGAGRLVRDAVRILLEGTPPGIHVREVAAALVGVEGVTSVHDLHVWALCSHIVNLSAHLVVCPGTEAEVRRAAEKVLAREYGIRHTTLQLEEESCRPDSEDILCDNLEH
ncbi:MAG: cation diffusion facilitator family transporter [Candidatus Zixiibacteriota bacterium]|jgi:cobalt-zinc-cadmium efflux system protein